MTFETLASLSGVQSLPPPPHCPSCYAVVIYLAHISLQTVPEGIAKDKAGPAAAVHGEILLGAWKLLVLWNGSVLCTCREVFGARRKAIHVDTFLICRGSPSTQDKRGYQKPGCGAGIGGGLTPQADLAWEDSCPQQGRSQQAAGDTACSQGSTLECAVTRSVCRGANP